MPTLSQAVRKAVPAPLLGRLAPFVTGQRYGYTKIQYGLTGELAKWKCRLASDYDAGNVDPADESFVRDFRRDEFVHLGQPFDRAVVDDIARRFDDLVTDSPELLKTSTYQFDGEEGVGSQRLNSWNDSVEILELIPELGTLLSDSVSEVIRAYYRSHFQVKSFQLYRNYHVPEAVAKERSINALDFHFDGVSTDHIKLFVYLNDVDETNGPFTVIPRPESKELVRSHGVYEAKSVFDEDSLVQFTGPKGSAALANTATCLHAATNPEAGKTRDILQIQLAPSRRPAPVEAERLERPVTADGSSPKTCLDRLVAY